MLGRASSPNSHCTRDRRHGARALRTKHPTLLQYVSANPPRAEQLLHDARTHAERCPRCYVVAGMVLFLPAPRDRGFARHSERGAGEGALLGTLCATVAECASG